MKLEFNGDGVFAETWMLLKLKTGVETDGQLLLKAVAALKILVEARDEKGIAHVKVDMNRVDKEGLYR